MNLFIPITKVDETRREVWGVAAEEAPDKSGEIMDYALSKPRFQEWSKVISDATGGKSLGNVRAMHQPIAAGKVISMQFDDESKRVLVGARIVDDVEWRKVTEGVYTGFSVGGRYGQQKFDGGLMRYEAIPSEVSIVDNPCMKGATFTMVKANGLTEQVPFVAASPELAKAADALLALAKAGARHSASDMQMIQTVHDHACSLGAACPTPEKKDEAMKSAGTSLRKDDSEPEFIAFAAASAVTDIASALAFVSGLASRITGSDAQTAAKLTEAARIISETLSTKVAEQGAATSAAAQDEAADEAMEAQIEAQKAAAAAAMQAAGEEFGASAPTDQTAPAQEPAPMVPPAAPVAPEPAEPAAPVEESVTKADMTTFRAALLADVKTAVKDIVNAGAAAPLHKIESANAELTKRFDEVAARLGALEGRIAKVESAPVGVGPVLREVGAASIADDSLIASLDQLIKDEADPTVRQALMQKRAAAALKNTYRTGGTRVG